MAVPPSSWVECFVSIRFDLDVGPRVEHVTPPGVLTPAGERAVCQAAFPDHNPDCGHDFLYTFTVHDTCLAATHALLRHEGHGDLVGPAESSVAPGAAASSESSPLATSASSPASSSLLAVGRARNRLLGVAYYRQKRDARVPRGFVQQVVVLLSRLPYLLAHELILRVVVPRFCQCCSLSPDTGATPVASCLAPAPMTLFEPDLSFNPAHFTQAAVLDSAMAELEQWPSPHPHTRYNATLLHQALSFVTPPREPRRAPLTRVLRMTTTTTAATTAPTPQLLPGAGTAAAAAAVAVPASAAEAMPPRAKYSLDDRVLLLDRFRDALVPTQACVPLLALLGGSGDRTGTAAAAAAAAPGAAPAAAPSLIPYLTRVWELLLAHQHLLILANTPTASAGAVLALLSLVMPIRFTGDVRTYFTVQDDDFREFAKLGRNGTAFPPHHGIVLATTNPYVLRSFVGWRNRLFVMDPHSNAAHAAAAAATTQSPAVGPLGGTTTPPMGSPSTPSTPASATKRGGSAAKPPSSPWAASGGGGSGVPFESSYPFVADHDALTKQLRGRLTQAAAVSAAAEAAEAGGAAALFAGGDPTPLRQMTLADDAARKFFHSITCEFLAPVNAWFAHVVAQIDANPASAPFCLSAPDALALFDPAGFLAYLKEHRKALAPAFLRGKRPYAQYRALYEAFSRGVLFVAHVSALLDAHVRTELEQFRPKEFARRTAGHSEAQRVDAFITLHAYGVRELQAALDPDVVLVSRIAAVLSDMALLVPSPTLRDELLSKAGALRL